MPDREPRFTRRVNMLLDPETDALLDRLAAAQHTSRSELVRRAVHALARRLDRRERQG